MSIRYKYLENMIIFLAVILFSFSTLNEAVGQNRIAITDFYEYANKTWLDTCVIPANTSVVNNWGVLWDRIIDKSIKILSSDSTYNLDENHIFILHQLQKLYKSTIDSTNDDRKRVQLVQKHYPMLLGIIFSKITVPPSKEEKINEIINFLTIAYRTKIEKTNRLGNYYKEKFLLKLDRMEFEIGSPDISDFPKMPTLSANSLERNIQLSNEYQLEKDKKKSDWELPPFETGCFYNFHDNKVKIYAGILFDSYSNEENDYVYLFATIGRTISHEMTHAFDNIGRRYNENGKYINWVGYLFSGALFSKSEWDNTYRALIEQYNQYTIQDTLYVNGKKTIQENIADLGGVEISLLALKLYLEKNQLSSFEKEKTEVLKKYFITYAQFWREKATSGFERSSLKRLHAPQKYRAIGPIYNQKEFYEVFEIDDKSKYYLPINLRVSIW